MNILLLGSGGREHALAWKMKQSPLCTNLFIAPGNGGTASLGENIPISPLDFEAVKKIVDDKKIHLLVVGSEQPAVAGIYDYFKSNPTYQNLQIISASKQAAMLEGSKAYAKEFMQENNIPTAKYIEVTTQNFEAGIQFLENVHAPYVLKADGLAEGKGVVILSDLDEAKKELEQFILHKKFGASSERVVIEEFLSGIEFSVFVLTNGKEYKILPNAKDYKRIGEGDKGLNTGGMGCISPVPFVDDAMMQKVELQVIKPTIDGLQKRNLEYKGFIYFGLINVQGNPMVIEYNCRLGDPETEVLLPRLENDLVALFNSLDTDFSEQKIIISSNHCATVMLVSGGYPEAYEKEKEISGLDIKTDSIIFHAGTKIASEKLVTNGGRVLAVTSLGNSLQSALDKSYQTIENIQFDKKNYRKDIGWEFLG